MPRFLGLDYGKKRIGIAVSDDEGRLAVPSGILLVSSRDLVFQELEKIIKEKGIGAIVVGLPLSMAGTASDQTKETQDFICALEEYTKIPVDFQDERLTSVQAERSGGNDAQAATLILQSYLERLQHEGRP